MEVWRRFPNSLHFWSDALNAFYSTYQVGTFASNGAIECVVPELPEGVDENTIKVAVQVYHENGRSVDADCFSHGGTTPDRFGEFGKFRYEENTAAMFPLTTYGQRETRACGPAPRERPPISPPRAAMRLQKGLRRDRRR